MKILPIVYAPNEIFRKKATIVENVTNETRQIVDAMFHTMYLEHGVGLGANMVGILQRIAVIDLQEGGNKQPYCFINPEITWHSKETQTFIESSLSFPSISAEIIRPKAIKMAYLDYNGQKQNIDADGFLATVIQHEIDYLDGKTFLNYLSNTKRDMLIRKMVKHLKQYPPHIHTEHCSH